jgi:rubrerythrin
MSIMADRDVRIGSVEELLSMAEALEKEAATRYRDLSARMARQGDAEMAAQFEVLAKMEELHADHVADRARALIGRAPAALRAKWDLPPNFDEDEASGAALGAYQALAFAVRNEERAFAFYTYIAAEAQHSGIRALAEDLARDELEHASILRHHRRRAFHVKRPTSEEIPGSLDALVESARRWDGEAAAAHGALAKALDEAGESEDAEIFRHLAAEEEKAAAGATGSMLPRLRSVADGLRLLEEGFDRFARIGERSDDESVVASAHRLAEKMIARLALAGGARSNTLLQASRGQAESP